MKRQGSKQTMYHNEALQTAFMMKPEVSGTAACKLSSCPPCEHLVPAGLSAIAMRATIRILHRTQLCGISKGEVQESSEIPRR